MITKNEFEGFLQVRNGWLRLNGILLGEEWSCCTKSWEQLGILAEKAKNEITSRRYEECRELIAPIKINRERVA